MSCVVGDRYLLDSAGDTVYCLAPEAVPVVEVAGFSDLTSEVLYVIERMPTYVVVAGAIVGLAMLFLAAYAVKGLMS